MGVLAKSFCALISDPFRAGILLSPHLSLLIFLTLERMYMAIPMHMICSATTDANTVTQVILLDSNQPLRRSPQPFWKEDVNGWSC